MRFYREPSAILREATTSVNQGTPSPRAAKKVGGRKPPWRQTSGKGASGLLEHRLNLLRRRAWALTARRVGRLKELVPAESQGGHDREYVLEPERDLSMKEPVQVTGRESKPCLELTVRDPQNPLHGLDEIENPL